jgi:hypothetical protein
MPVHGAKRATHLGVRIPLWLTVAAAVFVGLFGLYRIYLGTRKPETSDAPRRGFYAMGKRTHLFIGALYLILAGMLVAMSLGWTPLGNSVGPATEKPAKDKAPTKSGIPIDQLPSQRK